MRGLSRYKRSNQRQARRVHEKRTLLDKVGGALRIRWLNEHGIRFLHIRRAFLGRCVFLPGRSVLHHRTHSSKNGIPSSRAEERRRAIRSMVFLLSSVFSGTLLGSRGRCSSNAECHQKQRSTAVRYCFINRTHPASTHSASSHHSNIDGSKLLCKRDQHSSFQPTRAELRRKT